MQVWSPGRRYELELTFLTANMRSESQTVFVSEVPEREMAALVALTQKFQNTSNTYISPLCDLVPETRGGPLQDVMDEIDRYVSAFPDSRYSIYLRRTYLLITAQKTAMARIPAPNAQFNLKKEAEYVDYLKQNAPWANPRGNPPATQPSTRASQ